MVRKRIKCQRCGTVNILPSRKPRNPYPCMNCGAQIQPPLEPRKRTSYRTVWEYGGGDEESTNEKDAIL